MPPLWGFFFWVFAATQMPLLRSCGKGIPAPARISPTWQWLTVDA